MRRAARDVTRAPDVLRPPLKWAGGKRWQVPHVRPIWERHRRRRMVEPFCGGLAMSLGLLPQRALLNDANPHLVNFYRWLQQGLHTDLRMENRESLYYQHRDRFNALLAAEQGDTADAAALFYYLNRTGYNGLCRFNSRGFFNVPFGRYAGITYVRDFSAYQRVLRNWTFSAEPHHTLDFDRDDFVYADPPYDVEFTQYSRRPFSWDDQQATAERLARHRGPVVLVNQATDRVERLYRQLGFSVGYLDGPRRISCNGDRRPAREIIATRNV